MIVNFSEHDTIANRYIAELRDVSIQKDRMRFRKNLRRLGAIFAYEISKRLDYKEIEVETPLGIANTHVPASRIVLGTILRAGLPLHEGMLEVFDDADNAFVSAYRLHHKDGSFEIKKEYVSCPNLDDSVLILCDPMLATGASMHVALKELLENGTPKAVHIVTVIASADGLDYIRRTHNNAKVWIGAVDEELTARSYIVPGLGDAGDLCYGSKLQE